MDGNNKGEKPKKQQSEEQFSLSYKINWICDDVLNCLHLFCIYFYYLAIIAENEEDSKDLSRNTNIESQTTD